MKKIIKRLLFFSFSVFFSARAVSAEAPPSVEEAYLKTAPQAVFKITRKTGLVSANTGTGFLIRGGEGADGGAGLLLVTVFHTLARAVFSPARFKIKIQSESGGEILQFAEISHLSALHDLAVLKVAPKPGFKIFFENALEDIFSALFELNNLNDELPPVLALDESGFNRKGDKVTVLAFPEGKFRKIEGEFYQEGAEYDFLSSFPEKIKGGSGAPVLNSSGQVAAILHSGMVGAFSGASAGRLIKLLNSPALPSGADPKALIKEEIEHVGRLAERGNIEARHRQGHISLQGVGVEASYRKAFRWFEAAAEQGHAKAQYDLGIMLLSGIGIAPDYRKAADLFRKSAEQGFLPSQKLLGLMYLKGVGVGEDYGEYSKWLLQAAGEGYFPAIQNVQAAAARDKSAESQYTMGVVFLEGRGVEKNYDEAFRWFEAAAEQGHAEAVYEMAIMNLKGLGRRKDPKEALALLTQAANQGLVKAQHKAGLLYFQGLGTEKDYMKALALLTQAAEQGYVQAQYKAGIILLRGRGGLPQNFKEGIRLLHLAADQGHTPAQYELGYVYFEGRGAGQDLQKAADLFWAGEQSGGKSERILQRLHAASNRGDSAAKKILETLSEKRKALKRAGGAAVSACKSGILGQ